MGTDIHGVIQYRYAHMNEGYWVTEREFERERNYLLFAALGNVRNGFGFAGEATHTPIQPLTDNRGFPEDAGIIAGDSVRIDYDFSDEPYWLGDHSHSWCTLQEVLEFDWDQPIRRSGVIDRKQYRLWAGGNPVECCVFVFGPGIKVVDTKDPEEQWPEDWTHVRVYWEDPLRDSCEVFLAWLDYIRRKYADKDEVRLLFGFDS